MEPIHPPDIEYGWLIIVLSLLMSASMLVYTQFISLRLKDTIETLEGYVGWFISWLGVG